MKLNLNFIVGAVAAIMLSAVVHAEGNQVFYRYGLANLANSRGTQVFTDTLATNGKNDSKSGWNISGGLDINMLKDIWMGDVVGEVLVDYAHYAKGAVIGAPSALISKPAISNVTVSGLSVVIAPKYRFSGILDNKLRPWVIPIGLAFLVASPPSNDATYLDVGYHAGVGVEYAVISALSLGLDYRMTLAAKDTSVDMSNSQFDIYAGINF